MDIISGSLGPTLQTVFLIERRVSESRETVLLRERQHNRPSRLTGDEYELLDAKSR
jgi:hypothetical protein